MDQNEYTKCYTSELGTLLQLKAALKTKKLATPASGMIAAVPTVVYNDVTMICRTQVLGSTLRMIVFILRYTARINPTNP